MTNYTYKVAECWTLGTPREKMIVLARDAADIEAFPKDSSFIRWLDDERTTSKMVRYPPC